MNSWVFLAIMCLAISNLALVYGLRQVALWMQGK
jgi:hypothetical protein